MNPKRIIFILAPVILASCAIAPPAAPPVARDPSNSHAPEASSSRFHPRLVATNKTYLSSSAGANAQKMDMEMSGMDHGSMKMSGGMSGMEMAKPAGAPRNAAERKTAMEEKTAPSAPTGEQLQSTHPAAYTCRMHPEVKSAKPGKCPQCGMTLVSEESLEKQP